jgi:hypothetical protein
MATVLPPLASIHPRSAGEHAEFEQLRRLAEGLPEGYHLFHSVDWTWSGQQGDRHGELDIVVVNRAGDVAMLEVKSGGLQIDASGIKKQYQGQDKDVVRQAQWQFAGIQHRLRTEGLAGRLMHFLVLPDQQVGDQGSVGYPRDRIADAGDCEDLPGFIQRRLGSGQADPLQARVCAFFENRIASCTDVAVLSGRLRDQVERISGGLADWVPRITSPSGVIRVIGTAGSGKTQLALALLRQAVDLGQAAAYVCFNRPLADLIRGIAPAQVEVSTFHQLAWRHGGSPAGQPDHDQLVAAYTRSVEQSNPDLNLIVIDEVQDLQLPWVQALLARVRSSGRVYLLDDPDQGLYPDREELDIPDAVLVRSQENYRSPRRVVQFINALQLTDQAIQAMSPFDGQWPNFSTYRPDVTSSLVRATAKAVQSCLDGGHALEDICLITWRGVGRSVLLAAPTLGDWTLRRVTGLYDAAGRPEWTEGELQCDTLRRTKGQAATAVVLTEIHFDQLGPLERAMLFVGMTRARMHLELVMSEGVEALLATRIHAL